MAMFARYHPLVRGGDDVVAVGNIVRTIRTAEGVAAMFTTLAFFLMAVVLMLAVVGDALSGYFQRR